MQRLVEVKKRMHTIHDIRNVARTMATVASAKLSRTRGRAAGMRIYAERMRSIMRRQQAYLATLGIPMQRISPFFVPSTPNRMMLIHLAGDRGMCGNYNMAINHMAVDTIEQWREQGKQIVVECHGTKGDQYLRRRGGDDIEILDPHTWPRNGVVDELVDELHDAVTSAFLNGTIDEVWCTYTRFYTPLRREPTLIRLLPIAFENAASSGGSAAIDPQTADPHLQRFSYEPRFSSIVGDLVDAFVRIQCEDVLLEAYASEQGARMITMEEATERAGKRLHECHVLYNRLRREFITTDLLSVLFASHVRKREEDLARQERAEKIPT